MMDPMYLHYFTTEETFPFFIQLGHHDDAVDMHLHADYSELVIVLNGTALHSVDKESYFIKKGDVFILGDGIAHGYQDTNQLQICNIMFRPEFFITSDLDVRQLPGFHALFVIEPYLTKRNEFQSHLTLNLENYGMIHSLLNTMLEEYSAKKQGRKTLLTSLFLMLVTCLSRLYSIPQKNSGQNIINIANSVSYMEQHYKEELLIDDLAKISNLSTRHFTRIFSATYHTTPGKYILALRMQHAVTLLKSGQHTISETAFLSGFNDSNYFSRQFRKQYGISPREYLIRHKGN